MQVKENAYKKKLNHQCLTLTADVSEVLKTLNPNTNWKNQSIKLNKTSKPIKLNLDVTNRTIKPLKTVQQNPMTEADLDQLFQGKNKVKTEMAPISKVWNQGKDFIQNIKFLQVQDDWDRLLTGLPESTQQNDGNDMESKINSLFDMSNKKPDLTTEFKKDYLVGKVIGQGAYASVRIAIYKPLNQKIAIKVYEKNHLKQQQRKKSVRRQIKILQLLNHPNIVRIFDVVQTNNHLNIIMEYLSGISLGSYIKSQTRKQKLDIDRKITSEKICRKIIKPLAEALYYLHERSIAHRDIKLENVILDDQLSPKLIDFGFSTCIEASTKVKIFCGTPSYMAPQIVQKKQYRGEAADIWALGVLMFVALTGIFPFKGSTDQQLYRKITNCQYPREQLLCSKQLIDLLNKMLTVNPEQRITASKMLQHPWIKNTSISQIFNQGLATKRTKRADSSLQNKKRLTVSSRKSKEDTYNFNKLAETYKQNLKLQLKLAKQSPIHSQNNTCTNRRFEKELQNHQNKFLKTDKNIQLNATMGRKQQANKKPNSKVLQLLRLQMRKKHDEKSKGKINK